MRSYYLHEVHLAYRWVMASDAIPVLVSREAMEDFYGIRQVCEVSCSQHASESHSHIGHSIIFKVQEVANELLLEKLWIHEPYREDLIYFALHIKQRLATLVSFSGAAGRGRLIRKE